MAAAAAPTGEDSFLELRERLKQEIRNKRLKQKPQQQQQQNNSGLSRRLSATAVCKDYGSFFGPSLSSVAPRVIQECNILLQNPSLEKAEKVRVPPSKSKAEAIKVARDYSFLLTDDALAPVKSVSSRSKPVMESEELVRSRNGNMRTKSHGLNPGPTQLASKKVVVGKNLDGPAQSSGPRNLIKYSTKDNLIPKAKPGENLAQTTMAKGRPKKRPLREYADEENVDMEEIRKFVREIYRYKPRKHVKDDYDDYNMEASFHDILKEERRSAKIAKREDAEELQKILKENKREMMVKKRLKE